MGICLSVLFVCVFLRMVKSTYRILLIFLFPGCICVADEVDFNRDIRPLLSQNCFACHGPDQHERKGKLRLDTMEGSRKVIDEGDLSSSELIARIVSKDPEEQMPPPEGGKNSRRSKLNCCASGFCQARNIRNPGPMWRQELLRCPS